MFRRYGRRIFDQTACWATRQYRSHHRCSIQPPPRRHRTPLRPTAMGRESIGKRKRGAPCKPTKFATVRRPAATPCRTRRQRKTGGHRGGAVPAPLSKRPAATGSSGSIRTATKSRLQNRARTRSVRCCRRLSAKWASRRPYRRNRIPLPIRIGQLAEDLAQRKPPARADHGEVLVIHIDADVSGELELVAPDDGQIQRGTHGQV